MPLCVCTHGNRVFDQIQRIPTAPIPLGKHERLIDQKKLITHFYQYFYENESQNKIRNKKYRNSSSQDTKFRKRNQINEPLIARQRFTMLTSNCIIMQAKLIGFKTLSLDKNMLLQ